MVCVEITSNIHKMTNARHQHEVVECKISHGAKIMAYVGHSLTGGV